MAGLTQDDAMPGASGHRAIETPQKTPKKKINDPREHNS